MSEKLRNVLKNLKMSNVAEEAGISYAILRNFSCGKKQHLTDTEFNAVVNAIRTLTNLNLKEEQ